MSTEKRKQNFTDDDFDLAPKRPLLSQYAKTQSWSVVEAAQDESEEQLQSNCVIGQIEMDQQTLDYIWKLFNILDQNGDGTIDASDFLAADEQEMYYSTVLRSFLEQVKPEENGGQVGQIRRSDWITMFRKLMHGTLLPKMVIPAGMQFSTAVTKMMEHANKVIRDLVRDAVDYIIRKDSTQSKARK